MSQQNSAVEQPTVKIKRVQQIVRLRQMLRKWRKVASRVGVGGGPSPPAGHVAVYVGVGVGVGVGEERVRFLVKTSYLSHPIFRALLQKAEEEFGFKQAGALTIPCQVTLFQQLLLLLHQHPHPHQQSTPTTLTTPNSHTMPMPMPMPMPMTPPPLIKDSHTKVHALGLHNFSGVISQPTGNAPCQGMLRFCNTCISSKRRTQGKGKAV